MPGTALGAWNTPGNKRDKNFCPFGVYTLVVKDQLKFYRRKLNHIVSHKVISAVKENVG